MAELGGYSSYTGKRNRNCEENTKKNLERDNKIAELTEEVEKIQNKNYDLNLQMDDMAKKNNNKVAYLKVWLNQESERKEKEIKQEYEKQLNIERQRHKTRIHGLLKQCQEQTDRLNTYKAQTYAYVPPGHAQDWVLHPKIEKVKELSVALPDTLGGGEGGQIQQTAQLINSKASANGTEVKNQVHIKSARACEPHRVTVVEKPNQLLGRVASYAEVVERSFTVIAPLWRSNTKYM